METILVGEVTLCNLHKNLTTLKFLMCMRQQVIEDFVVHKKLLCVCGYLAK